MMLIGRVIISLEDVEFILQELESNRPFEACGVFVGTHENDAVFVKRTVQVKNSRRTERSFELDPVEFFKAWDEAEKNGLDIVGVYHTHPGSSARPSDWDKKSMVNSPPVWIIAGIDGIFAYQLLDGDVRKIDIICD